MTSYRFLNRDHTLVLRDDSHVIAWEPTTNVPIDRQPSSTDSAQAKTVSVTPLIETASEWKIWHDAGSPMPADVPGTSDSGSARNQPPDWNIPDTVIFGVYHPPEDIALEDAREDIDGKRTQALRRAIEKLVDAELKSGDTG